MSEGAAIGTIAAGTQFFSVQFIPPAGGISPALRTQAAKQPALGGAIKDPLKSWCSADRSRRPRTSAPCLPLRPTIEIQQFQDRSTLRSGHPRCPWLQGEKSLGIVHALKLYGRVLVDPNTSISPAAKTKWLRLDQSSYPQTHNI